MGNTCASWGTFGTVGATFTGGLPTSIGPRVLDGLDGTCASAAATAFVYCLGTDYASPLPARPIPPGGRRAFTSSSTNQGSFGSSGQYIETVCNNEAADAGLPGSYEVLRGGRSASACAPFNLDGGTWYRVDGAQLFTDPTSLCRATAPLNWLTAPGLHANGAPVASGAIGSTWVWTGNSFPGGAPPPAPSNSNNTCVDWTDSMVDFNSPVGESTDSAKFFNSGLLDQTCDNSFAVYCFQK